MFFLSPLCFFAQSNEGAPVRTLAMATVCRSRSRLGNRFTFAMTAFGMTAILAAILAAEIHTMEATMETATEATHNNPAVACCTTKTTQASCTTFACNNAEDSKCDNTNCEWKNSVCAEVAEVCSNSTQTSCCATLTTESDCDAYACTAANVKQCDTNDNCVWTNNECKKENDECEPVE